MSAENGLDTAEEADGPIGDVPDEPIALGADGFGGSGPRTSGK
ncbi:hypothetical protein [Streptomyces sp. V1I6]|nr:hypothetical protein [Streptomyces sp. V1I6]MDQ0841408.1 hypothetical protein [Streptomyces sp. V1I6]